VREIGASRKGYSEAVMRQVVILIEPFQLLSPKVGVVQVGGLQGLALVVADSYQNAVRRDAEHHTRGRVCSPYLPYRHASAFNHWRTEKLPSSAHCRGGRGTASSGLGARCLTARSRLDSPNRHL
jgi:hypothetical protein